MTIRALKTQPVGTPLDEAVERYLLNLTRDRSPNTLVAYERAITDFGRFLVAEDLPAEIERISMEHIEAWLNAGHQAGKAPATLSARLAILKTFFRFLVDREVIDRSPAERIRGIRMPERMTPILDHDDIAAMRKACKGRTFADLRARALLELGLDTGLRRAELAALTLEDVDTRNREAHVRHGKGDKERVARFTRETAEILLAYKSARRRHTRAELPWFWLGHRGRLTDAGIEEAMAARARAAGLDRFHLHMLRHTWAHNAKSGGMSDEAIMMLGGWSNFRVMSRYGKSASRVRAMDEYDRVFGR